MYFLENEANEIVSSYGHGMIKSNPELKYVAVVQDEKRVLKDNFYIELGIQNNNSGTATENFIEPVRLQSLNEIKANCEIHLKSSIQSAQRKGFLKNISLQTPINLHSNKVGELASLHFKDLRVRPMVGGLEISGSARRNLRGTLGAFLTLGSDDSGVYFITNYHNVADFPLKKNSYVFQPNDKCYDFTNYVGEVYFGQYGSHKNSRFDLDVAFVKLNNNFVKAQRASEHEGLFTNGSVLDRSKSNEMPFLSGITSPKIGMEVKMNGKSTGNNRKTGVIRSINATVEVKNPYFKKNKKLDKDSICNDEYTIFKEQLLISKANPGDDASFSRSGDSGSVLVKESTNEVVGLIHAGDSLNITIANNIKHIFMNKYPASGMIQKITFNRFIT